MTDPVIQIKTWHELLRYVESGASALLDVRDADAFARGHLAGSASRPVPVGASGKALTDLLPGHLLPPRHARLLVLSDDADHARQVAEWLSRRGRDAVTGCAPEWSAAPDGALETGVRGGRLWQPPPWLADHADLLPPAEAGPVVDLGGGSGRASVWLAERGYDVTLIDRHDEALGWGRDLAADAGCSLTTLRADLTDPAAWPPGPWAVALALRFLHRPLVEALPGMVRPGGIAVVRTFRWEEGPWTLPRRRFCLEPGELARLFRPDRWEILVHHEDVDPDGRPASGVVARRLDDGT